MPGSDEERRKIRQLLERGQFDTGERVVPPLARLSSMGWKYRRLAYGLLAAAKVPPAKAWADVEGDIIEMVEDWEITEKMIDGEEPF